MSKTTLLNALEEAPTPEQERCFKKQCEQCPLKRICGRKALVWNCEQNKQFFLKSVICQLTKTDFACCEVLRASTGVDEMEATALAQFVAGQTVQNCLHFMAKALENEEEENEFVLFGRVLDLFYGFLKRWDGTGHYKMLLDDLLFA